MIISHKYRFIFIKTNKTAGTSVEIALSGCCGDEDIITPITQEDEKIRRELGHRGPQNYIVSDRNTVFEFYNHISSAEVIGQIGQGAWNNYYTFCFERNPWDRVVSLYYNLTEEPRPSMTEFMATGVIKLLKQRGLRLYSNNGAMNIDEVFRYERLRKDLELVWDKLDIAEPLVLPETKAHFRSVKIHYSNYFTEAEQEKVARMFNDEIALLGYQFERG